MGGNTSKLRKHLEHGDEYAALKIIEKHDESVKNLDPNEPITELNESAVHLAAKFAMKPLLRLLLYDSTGDPLQCNALHQNALHLICQIPKHRKYNHKRPQYSHNSINERRNKCLALILQWKSTDLASGTSKSIDVSTLDRSGNTALHYAASNGLMKCCQILVDRNCPLFIENDNDETACDLAAKFGHKEIAEFLEFKMVLDNQNALQQTQDLEPFNENFSGLRAEDLQEAKDLLLGETSNILHVPLPAAEALLRCFDWSLETLLESWINDEEYCYHKAGLEYPIVVSIETQTETQDVNNEENHEEPKLDPEEGLACASTESTPLCGICSLEVDSCSEFLHLQCKHIFCRGCWKTYIEMKIKEGDSHIITCPEFSCNQLIQFDFIEKIASPQLANKFIQFDIDAFVDSNPNIKWCPFPGCGRAVHLPKSESEASKKSKTYVAPNLPPLPPISHAVDCGFGHYFCWDCRREAHAPCHCKLWDDWMLKISDVSSDDLRQTYSKTEDAANCLWLVRNSKQCPHCKAHIQKTEGCNHMRCGKCKHDFCWICLDSWKKHNSSTGGYFRCNRSEAAQKAQENVLLLKRVAEARNLELQELKRFVHHYTKYKLNESAHDAEFLLIEKCKQKQRALNDYFEAEYNKKCAVGNPPNVENKEFLHEAVMELLKTRKILCGSAVYGYYLDNHGYNQTIFEYMEEDLNIACIRLSEIISGDYLKVPKTQIIVMTAKVRRKRLEFLKAVENGLTPPETPPGLRTRLGIKKRRLPGVLGLDPIDDDLFNSCNDDDEELLTRAIIASLDDLDANNPWVKDNRGKHNNLTAIYDWPDDSDEDEDKTHIKAAQVNNKALSSLVCDRPQCEKPRVRNPRTGEWQMFCSIKCKQMTLADPGDDEECVVYEPDTSMDMLLAIEMSKITAIEEENRRSLINTYSNSEMDDGPSSTCLQNNDNILETLLLNVDGNHGSPATQSAKNAIIFFLKGSKNIDDDKNLNSQIIDAKVNKLLFSPNQASN